MFDLRKIPAHKRTYQQKMMLLRDVREQEERARKAKKERMAR